MKIRINKDVVEFTPEHAAEAAELEAALADPDTYQDAEKAARLARAYQQKKDEIEGLYQAWEALESEA